MCEVRCLTWPALHIQDCSLPCDVLECLKASFYTSLSCSPHIIPIWSVTSLESEKWNILPNVFHDSHFALQFDISLTTKELYPCGSVIFPFHLQSKQVRVFLKKLSGCSEVTVGFVVQLRCHSAMKCSIIVQRSWVSTTVEPNLEGCSHFKSDFTINIICSGSV